MTALQGALQRAVVDNKLVSSVFFAISADDINYIVIDPDLNTVALNPGTLNFDDYEGFFDNV